MSRVDHAVKKVSFNKSQGRFTFGRSPENEEGTEYASFKSSQCGDADNCEFEIENVYSRLYCRAVDGCEARTLKNRKAKGFFSTKYSMVQNRGKLEDLYNLTNVDVDSSIEIISPTIRPLNIETDTIEDNIGYKQTLAFDVVVDEDGNYKDVLAVIEDGNGDVRIVGMYGEQRIAVLPSVTKLVKELSEIKDVVIHQPFGLQTMMAKFQMVVLLFCLMGIKARLNF